MTIQELKKNDVHVLHMATGVQIGDYELFDNMFKGKGEDTFTLLCISSDEQVDIPNAEFAHLRKALVEKVAREQNI